MKIRLAFAAIVLLASGLKAVASVPFGSVDHVSFEYVECCDGGGYPTLHQNPVTQEYYYLVDITMAGWAADAEEGTSVTVHPYILYEEPELGAYAQNVNMTYGISRPDVAAAYNNPAYANSGWSTTFRVEYYPGYGTLNISAVELRDGNSNPSPLIWKSPTVAIAPP